MKPRRLRWFQFSLRSLFILMLLACVGMSCVSVMRQQARKQKESVGEIEELGGRVLYCQQNLLGMDCFRIVTVVGVTLDGTRVTDAGLEHLKGLNHLEDLSLDKTRVGDAGLECLKGLKHLRDLRLDETQVSDAGLEHLKGLGDLSGCGSTTRGSPMRAWSI